MTWSLTLKNVKQTTWLDFSYVAQGFPWGRSLGAVIRHKTDWYIIHPKTTKDIYVLIFVQFVFILVFVLCVHICRSSYLDGGKPVSHKNGKSACVQSIQWQPFLRYSCGFASSISRPLLLEFGYIFIIYVWFSFDKPFLLIKYYGWLILILDFHTFWAYIFLHLFEDAEKNEKKKKMFYNVILLFFDFEKELIHVFHMTNFIAGPIF